MMPTPSPAMTDPRRGPPSAPSGRQAARAPPASGSPDRSRCGRAAWAWRSPRSMRPASGRPGSGYDPPAMSDTSPSLATPYRTHTCGQLRADDAEEPARLAGWVHRRRDHGQLIFLDLRDRHGITQVVIDKTDAPEAHAEASRIRHEFVVTVAGTVAQRLPGTENTKLPTGAIELQ